ncbi:beta strand repeat-containing protein [Methylomagnum ishizawai]|uniref:beta strand repeat-containing protein n=1 Tax=Methylomagnum ishizawai TaxID=1760988 RepID=UPI001C325C45|nr:calcium-binding protein [Methylomagnum ishizawai]BBL73323.1 hypothetical protein MishRS11D_04210 [Methylomagnum ishizawai]
MANKFFWSTVTETNNNATIGSFDPSADIFVFDHDSSSNEISAAQVTISTVGNSPTGDVTFSYNDNGTTKTVTITGLSLSELTTTTSDAFGNVRFNDQSVLIVGDNISNTPGATTLDNAANTLTGGPGNDQLVGLGGNDSLVGKGGDDLLIGNGFGTTGTDILVGGAGNDTYVVDNSADVITESSGAANGTADLVQSSVSFTLAANVEQLTLLDTSYGVSVGAINGTGNTAGNNILTGNSSANTLSDNNGTAKDTLVGGLGNDTYIIGNTSDVITESGGTSGGIDLIQTAKTYSISSLADIEQLTLTGSANIDGTGNAANNTLLGNSGNNNLNGGTGADSMAGGTGNDTYTVDNLGDTATESLNSGTDLVQSSVNFTLGTNVEQLTLTGSAVSGTGNTAANTIIGNASDNTLSDGGIGLADSMVGGAGNDTYTVNNTGDIINETANGGAGTDSVNSSVTFTLATGVEKLTLADSGGAINGTGNAAANTIVGNSLANILSDGGVGSPDSLDGQLGNDTYLVNNSGDIISDSGGTDTVQSTKTYDLSANATTVDKLTLLDSGGAINATGNSLANTITGNTAANTLDDGGSNAADSMAGGAGNDTYVVHNSGDTISDSSGTDTVQSSVDFTLAATSGIEILTLTGAGNIDATGSTAANTLNGNGGDNVLTDGGTSADSMAGGAGNDTYFVNNIGDKITESSGAANGTADWVQSSVTFTLTDNIEKLSLLGTTSAINGKGNSSSNTIIGNGGNNILDDGTATPNAGGADSMDGGDGNDTYLVNHSGDTITDSNGTDLVQSTVTYDLSTKATTVDKLTLLDSGGAINATGNALANTITGNSLANTLSDGGAGAADSMAGLAGDDTYTVNNAGDTISDSAGTDLVQSNVSFTLTATSGIEKLTLLSNANAINATGNALANTITGNSLANTLSDGGAGAADSLIGGAGNDTYVVNNTGDAISDTGGDSADLIQSTVTFSLSSASVSGVEKLTLTGTSAINGTGNTAANTIIGNDGANTLSDGGSNSADSLAGGKGSDTYIVNNASDTISESGTSTAEGTADLVQSFVTSFTLSSNVEQLTLMTGAVNGTGSGDATNNLITGNSSANTLNDGGGDGNDTLNGGAGNDTLVATSSGIDTLNGGDGSDLYQVSVDNSSTTTTINISDSGTVTSDVDTVEATLATGETFTLENINSIEKLTLLGPANSSGTGNLLNNTITGNTGANVLVGLAGNDILYDGASTAANSSAADSMNGGVGNDTYYVTNSNDKVSEAASDIGDQSADGSGTDIVFASVSFTLDDAGTIEKLTLTANSITGTGNFQDNTIVGSTGSNTLLGGAGNDILDDGITASGSADSMNGQDGNDTYFVHHTGDTVVDSSGTDTVQSTVTFTLANSIENLTLLDVGGAINGTGSTAANKIIGNSSVNTLSGGSDTASDTLQGGGGNDIITVGGGKDTVVFEANAVANGLGDSVSGFTVGSGSSADKLDFNNFFGAATNITVLPAVAEGSSGAVAIATGNVLQVIDTGGNLDATGIAALFGTGKPFEAALASEKFVMITADTSGDAKGWYIDVGANAIVDASDVSQVVTLVGVNNLATTPLVSANIVA